MFQVTLAGHVGKDPETRFTPNGQKVTTFSIATNHRKSKEDVTIWVRVTVWGDRFDKMLSYIKKGSGVIVTGRMNPPSSYTDKEGRTQVSLEVTAEMIEFSPFGRNDRQGENQSENFSNQYGAGQTTQANSSSPYQPNASYGQSSVQQGYGAKLAGQGAQPVQGMEEEDTLPF